MATIEIRQGRDKELLNLREKGPQWPKILQTKKIKKRRTKGGKSKGNVYRELANGIHYDEGKEGRLSSKRGLECLTKNEKETLRFKGGEN